MSKRYLRPEEVEQVLSREHPTTQQVVCPGKKNCPILRHLVSVLAYVASEALLASVPYLPDDSTGADIDQASADCPA